MFRKIKWFFQRGVRGYADCDVWSFDTYLNTMVPKALRNLKKKHVGSPSEFYDESAAPNHETDRWIEALEAMAQGFEAAQFLKDGRYHVFAPAEAETYIDGKKVKGSVLKTDYKAMQNAEKKMNLGLKLFVENYLNLWD